MKDGVENVRIFDPSGPAQRIELERAAGDVGKKSGELEAANVERNADFPQLLMHESEHEACVFVCSVFHRDMKTHAFHGWMASGIEQLPSLSGIVIVADHFVVVSPTLRWQ